MTQEEYLNQRLEDQFAWYDRKSVIFQRNYKRMQVSKVVAAALIPLMGVIPVEGDYTKIIMAVLGALIVVFEGINALYKYQELWISYRTTAETLKHHKFLFETNCKPYEGKNAFQKLVINVESLISKENSDWTNMFKDDEDKEGVNNQ